jgi:hypothetical protein
MTSRFLMSWILLVPQCGRTSQRKRFVTFVAVRICDTRSRINVSTRSSIRSTTKRRRDSFFSSAGSRPSTLAAKIFCACLAPSPTSPCCRDDRVFAQSRTGARDAIHNQEDLSAFGCHLHTEARKSGVPIDNVLRQDRQVVDRGLYQSKAGNFALLRCYLNLT